MRKPQVTKQDDRGERGVATAVRVMRCRNVSRWFTLLIAACLLPAAARSQGAGKTGWSFLKLGVGGRAAGMAESFVAVANDPTATYWNPAGLQPDQGTMAVFSHHALLQDIRADFLAISFPAFRGAIGLGLNLQTIPGIERRITPAPEPIGLIDSRDLSLALAYGHAINHRLQVGLTVKYLYEKIDVESASGLAFDAGVLIKNLVDGLRLGAALQNLGSAGRLRHETIDLPALARLGVAYVPAHLAGGALTLSSEAMILFGSQSSVSVAGEYVVQSALSLRGGYQFNRDNRGVAGGVGLQWGRYQLDYGYMPFASGLGDTHRFSLALKL